MSVGSATGALRTLFEAGTLGNLSDARLVERFVDGVDQDREDAFGVLVGRHGPMVRGVCRRMLADPADADDAFQAVFLILARKAGSLRQAERLKPWLHGVAVRVAKESRRRSERIKIREGGTLIDIPAPAARDDLFELRQTIDEELNNLPRRYREPLLLCDLEGESRREAARKLGLAEGTLSSRLARGRALLRDRLTRRGLSAGSIIPLFPKTAAPGFGPLADASVRLSLAFTTRGAVPAGLASLAEGVLQMLAASKLKTVILAAAASLCAIGLTAGLARGFGVVEDPQHAAFANEAQAGRPLEARGVVVDEEGRPVAGAEVRINPFAVDERRGVTDFKGGFAVPIGDEGLGHRWILARAADKGEVGIFRYGAGSPRALAENPVRIVVEPPGRVVSVRVAEEGGAPVAGALVEAAAGFLVLAHATTGPDGVARLAVPKDAGLDGINWIFARKNGAGYGCAELGEFREDGSPSAGLKASELPDSLSLTLDAPRTVQLRIREPNGGPAAGVPLVARIRLAGQRGVVQCIGRLYAATTDAEGIATFDWLPSTAAELRFFSFGDRHVRRWINEGEGQAEAEAKLSRVETIRGRVRLPDGSSAVDAPVSALGIELNSDGRPAASGFVEADGSYELKVEPDASYVVSVQSDAWRAPAWFGVVVRSGEPVEGVDFRFERGTILRGTVTVGPGHQPAAGQPVRVAPLGKLRPDSPADAFIPLTRIETTDEQGRYEFRLAPGNYALAGPDRARREAIAIGDAPVIHDIHLDRLMRSGWIDLGTLRAESLETGRSLP